MKNSVLGLWLFFLVGCTATKKQQHEPVSIAFMADIHFADVYPDLVLPSTALPSSPTGIPILIRTMEAQLHSTRLFNENYFAFTAALDDAVSRGIKIIAIPGDFSDDGQALYIKGLNRIMKTYRENHGISFFMINGNHDPTRPFGKDGGERDFLGRNGKAQPIMSHNGMYASNLDTENPTEIIDGLMEWGYAEIAQELRAYGFFPNETYGYWETPFSTYNYESYEYGKAQEASQLHKRTYNLDVTGIHFPDLSYLVEPVNGLWLLALDANVYLPKPNGTGYNGAGIGYNEVLEHKKYLLEWTGKIVKQANRLGKTLIAFSHYPMVDFNDGASNEMLELFGKTSFQAHRIPSKRVGEAFADLGLKVHVGGHMHLNDTGILKTSKGTLVNIQTPSLAAYVPSYKVITVTDKKTLAVETVVLDSVLQYDAFFDLYTKEHSFLEANFPDRVWDEKILGSTSYTAFTDTHLRELIRLRFLPDDWPEVLKEQLLNKDGWQLVLAASKALKKGKVLKDSQTNEERLMEVLRKNQMTKRDFQSWSGEDLIIDFYRFRNGDQLALRDIDQNRLKAYTVLFQQLSNTINEGTLAPLRKFAAIFQKQMKGEPSVDFRINY